MVDTGLGIVLYLPFPTENESVGSAGSAGPAGSAGEETRGSSTIILICTDSYFFLFLG